MAELGNPKNTIEVLQKYQFHFAKKFGQNFLIDTHVLDKIVRAAEITPEDYVLEIGPGIGTGVIQKNMIEKVLEYHNIPIDNAYAIGDSMNDLPMLTAVPNSIVMGNGSEELKKSASFVTKDLLDNGIEYALKHFGMI